jgi:hypothetical protein
MDKARRTAAQWAEIFEAFEASGRTAMSFCAERGLSASYFYKRHKRWRTSRSSAFVPVRVDQQVPSSAPIVIEVDALTIRCNATTPPSWIAELVSALR